jgi:hypothetical protein
MRRNACAQPMRPIVPPRRHHCDESGAATTTYDSYPSTGCTFAGRSMHESDGRTQRTFADNPNPQRHPRLCNTITKTCGGVAQASAGEAGLDLELRFGPALVGTADGAFCSEFTWCAMFRPTPGIPPRVREFIAFGEEWHERLKAGRPHSAAEFDAFRDIHESELWQARGPDGHVPPVEGPVFVEGEVSWRGPPDAEPGATPDPAGM